MHGPKNKIVSFPCDFASRQFNSKFMNLRFLDLIVLQIKLEFQNIKLFNHEEYYKY